jgi:protein O-mannosyl-transferase
MAVRHRKDKPSTSKLPSVRGNSASAAPHTARRRKRTRLTFAPFYVCLALVAITWLVFGQTLWHDFVNLDDHVYVYDNPLITHGLTPDGVINAFVQTHARNWHPLTTLSHMLDCQLFGLKAGGHHFTNVLLHSVAVVLLFLLLKQMTGAFWQSAFVAALFAIHPLHVESVAWVSERKDVLSAVFFMLTLWAYVRYVRARSTGRYLTVALFLALGLMSKPMLVTVPFVLLLLDYWPLHRFSGDRTRLACGDRRVPHRARTVAPLLVEKIPLFALCAFSCIATLLVQLHGAGAIDQLPFAWRLNNAAVSYVAYIWQMFWPAQLAAFYPHPNDQLPLWQVILAITFLISVSLLAIQWRRKRPYVFTGWFWYVGMLVPVIGFVQAGEQGRADRYTYLPQIGLYLLIAWGVTDLMTPIMARNSGSRPVAIGLRPLKCRSRGVRTNTQQGRGYKPFFTAIATTIIIALSWRAFVQTSYWENSEKLWNHALAVTTDNAMAHNNLGHLLLQRGEWDSAISRFESALTIRSHNAATHYNLGRALMENNLANALARKGRLDEAVNHYEESIRLRPDYGDPYFNLGSVLFQQGRIDDAIVQWHKALAAQPNDAGFHTALGNAFLKKGLQKDAIAEYEHAARISRQDPMARNNLAWLLATSSDTSIRDGNRAIEVAKQAVQLSGGQDANYLRTLAAGYAETGRFAEAKETARRGLQAAQTQGNSVLANALRDEIALYELGLPYHK